ncbi:hypothetical protein C1646_777101 [Rhizophagus diaphanus]|nr:hypothetical protein C1646_777101 [Rhizophagus diaphanus] [Rhizophagus sp. MUCL 43196]
MPDFSHFDLYKEKNNPNSSVFINKVVDKHNHELNIEAIAFREAIQKFHSTTKSLSNDTAKMLNWLDQQKEIDSRWVVTRERDNDNTLTHLMWMTSAQVESWILYRTRGFQQNGVCKTAETSFAKLSRNAETAKPIKITKLP